VGVTVDDGADVGPVHAATGAAAPVPGADEESPVARVTILTSGTSGQVKAVRHAWAGLTRPVRRVAEGSSQRWLLAYRPHLYAGLQVLLQALLNGGTLVAPGPRDDPDQILRLMAEARVEFASATPSYWRRLVLWGDPQVVERVALRQITLGGEAIDQEILDRLHRAFPEARLVHIYATTELGRCFSVTDGLSGFPASYLHGASAEGVELQVRDQQLYVRSANAMQAYVATADAEPLARADDQGWFPTGDLVEVSGSRVRFVGRASDMINVGGNKVYPLLVERTIREVPGVADVRVFGQASSIAGQLVACEVVPAPGEDLEALRARILDQCRGRLDRYQCPRVVQFVQRLELTAAGKVQRAVNLESR
jgi:acyl-CoA synthetase (AMP-forming)/AMP-acid ligase II